MFIPNDLLNEVFNNQFDNFRAYVNKNNATSLHLAHQLKNRDVETGAALKLIGEALKDTQITDVNLSYNEITTQSAIDFCANLKNTNVTHVNLGYNEIDHQYAKEFANALENTNVTHVDLTYNRIGRPRCRRVR